MATAAVTEARSNSFTDPVVLSRIGNLELLAKVVVEGFINGLHRSPHLGASTDFAEHRAYMPGDDIRRSIGSCSRGATGTTSRNTKPTPTPTSTSSSTSRRRCGTGR